LSNDAVRRFWENASAEERDAQNLRPTARDPWLQQCVESTMETLLPSGASLLDVGCGDGASTLRFAKTAGRVYGVDFIERYVERARAAAAQASVTNVRFSTADVRDLSSVRAQIGQVRVATSIRCLINLATPEDQERGIAEIARMVEPGGLYLASEGWTEGMAGLNARRTAVGLSPIRVAQYNLLMTRRFFEDTAARWFDVAGYHSLGLYLFLSRVLQPLYTAPAPAMHDHPINKAAARLQQTSDDSHEFLDCDYAGVYVLRRHDNR
jgi:2-polyprenyl-3-methyl-5-hydroxy-6-metoxy-1,4-benzoquinol methylase